MLHSGENPEAEQNRAERFMTIKLHQLGAIR